MQEFSGILNRSALLLGTLACPCLSLHFNQKSNKIEDLTLLQILAQPQRNLSLFDFEMSLSHLKNSPLIWYTLSQSSSSWKYAEIEFDHSVSKAFCHELLFNRKNV
jgi:hypothetical protein